MHDAMDLIEAQVEGLRMQLRELQERFEKLEKASNAIYLKHLDMMGEPEDVRNSRIMKMWEEVLEKL